MRILGISAGFHDAAVSIIDQGHITFAAHSERYSKTKHDPNLNDKLIADALADGPVDLVAYYERPWMKKILQCYSGQYREAFSFNNLTLKQYFNQHLSTSVHLERLLQCPRKYMSHHLSHAAGGFQTSPFESAAVVVIDAIGELDTISIYRAWYDSLGQAQYQRVWNQRYPHSIGLFYSAVTEHIGLHPMDEEYITMGMSAYGRTGRTATEMSNRYIQDYDQIKLKENLHLGITEPFKDATETDIAAGAQFIVEMLITTVAKKAKELTGESNLVYSGGVALNCSANRHLGKYFDRIWIMPAPGDAGSSLGAAALAYGQQIHWTNAYLGYNISGDYPVDNVIHELVSNQIVGVASGRAEFGPRALGNRSLLADPRGPEIKDRVNEIKRRQKFRPFAPVILEEHVDMYFDMPPGFSNSRYMQVIARCRHPDLFPAIIHVDGTSRVQTVPPDGSGIRQLLEKWYAITGCPMLLNTSLNVRGEPMVNDRADADRFEQLYGIKVCS